MEIPLNIQLENLRGKLNTAISEVIMEYGLPAYLVTGVLADVLLEVKRQEKLELLNSYNSYNEQLKEETENGK